MLAAVAMDACVPSNNFKDSVRDGRAIILGPTIVDGSMRRAPVRLFGEDYIASVDVEDCFARGGTVYVHSQDVTFFHGTIEAVRQVQAGNNVFDHLCYAK